MKRNFNYILLEVIIISATLIFLSACTSIQKGSKEYYQQVYEKASILVKDSDNEEAEALLLEAVATRKPQQSPFVENNTLIFYGEGMSQTLSKLMFASAFSTAKDNDSIKTNPGHYKILFDLYKQSHWENSVIVPAYYPKLYLLLGIIQFNKNNFSKAIQYYDTAVYIWDGLGIAWSELIIAHDKSGNRKRAKEIGNKALEIPDIYNDNYGKSAILRKLGWIAIEESELDKAEAYFKESIELHDTKLAQDELKYIQKMKMKK
jgi:tetratricopeptide (TPR) repeat protein